MHMVYQALLHCQTRSHWICRLSFNPVRELAGSVSTGSDEHGSLKTYRSLSMRNGVKADVDQLMERMAPESAAVSRYFVQSFDQRRLSCVTRIKSRERGPCNIQKRIALALEKHGPKQTAALATGSEESEKRERSGNRVRINFWSSAHNTLIV